MLVYELLDFELKSACDGIDLAINGPQLGVIIGPLTP
jgi:hypothetical protein